MKRVYEVLYWIDKVRGDNRQREDRREFRGEAKRKFREGNNHGKAIAGVGPARRNKELFPPVIAGKGVRRAAPGTATRLDSTAT